MSGDFKPLTAVETCKHCDTALVYEVGEGAKVKFLKFTAHDDEFCLHATRARVQMYTTIIQQKNESIAELQWQLSAQMRKNDELRLSGPHGDDELSESRLR